MNRSEIEAYIEIQYGVKAEYPFEMDNETAVFRQKSNRKWFVIIMRVSKRRLHIDSDEEIDIMNVKCDPILIGSFLLDTGFYPAYHMNKTHWITVSPDADEDKVKMLIDMSFSLTALRRKKAIK